MSDAKFEEKLALGCKNDMMNLVNFNVSSDKWEFALWCASFANRIKRFTYNVQKRYLSWHWRVIQTGKKLTFFMKNDMNNLVNFNSSSGKSENLYGIFLSKGCNAWAKKIETSCVVKNDIWLQKWHKEFGEFSE